MFSKLVKIGLDFFKLVQNLFEILHTNCLKLIKLT
jgi:hypothetical protein